MVAREESEMRNTLVRQNDMQKISGDRGERIGNFVNQDKIRNCRDESMNSNKESLDSIQPGGFNSKNDKDKVVENKRDNVVELSNIQKMGEGRDTLSNLINGENPSKGPIVLRPISASPSSVDMAERSMNSYTESKGIKSHPVYMTMVNDGGKRVSISGWKIKASLHGTQGCKEYDIQCNSGNDSS